MNNILEIMDSGKAALTALSTLTKKMNQMQFDALPLEWRLVIADYSDASKDLTDSFIAMASAASRLAEENAVMKKEGIKH
jgi:hypothetical protein